MLSPEELAKVESEIRRIRIQLLDATEEADIAILHDRLRKLKDQVLDNWRGRNDTLETNRLDRLGKIKTAYLDDRIALVRSGGKPLSNEIDDFCAWCASKGLVAEETVIVAAPNLAGGEADASNTLHTKMKELRGE